LVPFFKERVTMKGKLKPKIVEDLIVEYNITPNEQKALMEYLLFLRWRFFVSQNRGLIC